jgi:hypothetical protein
MAFFCADEPEPLMLPLAQLIDAAELAAADGPLPPELLLSEPQAATPTSAATAMPAAAD